MGEMARSGHRNLISFSIASARLQMHIIDDGTRLNDFWILDENSMRGFGDVSETEGRGAKKKSSPYKFRM